MYKFYYFCSLVLLCMIGWAGSAMAAEDVSSFFLWVKPSHSIINSEDTFTIYAIGGHSGPGRAYVEISIKAPGYTGPTGKGSGSPSHVAITEASFGPFDTKTKMEVEYTVIVGIDDIKEKGKKVESIKTYKGKVLVVPGGKSVKSTVKSAQDLLGQAVPYKSEIWGDGEYIEAFFYTDSKDSKGIDQLTVKYKNPQGQFITKTCKSKDWSKCKDWGPFWTDKKQYVKYLVIVERKIGNKKIKRETKGKFLVNPAKKSNMNPKELVVQDLKQFEKPAKNEKNKRDKVTYDNLRQLASALRQYNSALKIFPEGDKIILGDKQHACLNKTSWHPAGCKDAFIDSIAQSVARKLVYSKYFDDYFIAYELEEKYEYPDTLDGSSSDKVWSGKRLYTIFGDFQNNEQGMKKIMEAKKIKDAAGIY